MIQHYLKIALRNLLKYRMQTLISIIGLTVGFVIDIIGIGSHGCFCSRLHRYEAVVGRVCYSDCHFLVDLYSDTGSRHYNYFHQHWLADMAGSTAKSGRNYKKRMIGII